MSLANFFSSIEGNYSSIHTYDSFNNRPERAIVTEPSCVTGVSQSQLNGDPHLQGVTGIGITDKPKSRIRVFDNAFDEKYHKTVDDFLSTLDYALEYAKLSSAENGSLPEKEKEYKCLRAQLEKICSKERKVSEDYLGKLKSAIENHESKRASENSEVGYAVRLNRYNTTENSKKNPEVIKDAEISFLKVPKEVLSNFTPTA